MRAGRLTKWVTLSRAPQTSGDEDGFFEPLDPEGAWAFIQPMAPAPDGRSISSLVTMRYHPQVGLDTRLVYAGREFFVRGVQNVDEANVELHLLCEEIVSS
jgi:head-tail adaptor